MKKILLMAIPILWMTTLFGQGSPCWFDSLRLKNFDASPKHKQDEDLFYYRLNKWRKNNTVTLDNKPVNVSCSTCLTTTPSA